MAMTIASLRPIRSHSQPNIKEPKKRPTMYKLPTRATFKRKNTLKTMLKLAQDHVPETVYHK